MGPRTDVFNLGATMYWALSGKNVPTLIPKKDQFGLPVHERRRTPHEIRKKIPLPISRLVMECVAEEPADRPQNMMNIISRLDTMIHGLLSNRTAKANGKGQ
jgi:hypothetical protein